MLAQSCWSQDPAHRPTSAQLVIEVKQLLARCATPQPSSSLPRPPAVPLPELLRPQQADRGRVVVPLMLQGPPVEGQDNGALLQQLHRLRAAREQRPLRASASRPRPRAPQVLQAQLAQPAAAGATELFFARLAAASPRSTSQSTKLQQDGSSATAAAPLLPHDWWEAILPPGATSGPDVCSPRASGRPDGGCWAPLPDPPWYSMEVVCGTNDLPIILL